MNSHLYECLAQNSQLHGHLWSTYVNRCSYFPSQSLILHMDCHGNHFLIHCGISPVQLLWEWILSRLIGSLFTHATKWQTPPSPFHPSHFPSLPLSLLQVHGLLEILLLSLLAIDIVLRLIWLRPRHFIQHKRTAFIVRGLHNLLAVYIAIDSCKIE